MLLDLSIIFKYIFFIYSVYPHVFFFYIKLKDWENCLDIQIYLDIQFFIIKNENLNILLYAWLNMYYNMYLYIHIIKCIIDYWYFFNN